MTTFVILGRLTDKALAHMNRAAERDADGDRIIESVGGTVLAHYYTFGRYDFVVIVDLPSAAALAKALVEMGKWGTVTTETMTAMTPDEVYRVVKEG
ncbi:MAG: GYD domain-containing protein [Methanospirillum sp.]